jgi:hypothetical protein
VTPSLVFGFLVSLGLIAGSFYLSINGAHRLVDDSQNIVKQSNSLVNNEADSIAQYYDKEIAYYRNQKAVSRVDRKYRDSIVASLQSVKDEKIGKIEQKIKSVSEVDLDKNKENDNAFIFITFFLEFIIILGVGFNSFYTIGSYNETKELLETPKYKEIQLYLKLLKIYYQNGKKVKGDQTISASKLISLVKSQKINCTQSEVRGFIALCAELEIVKENRSRRKEYNTTYEDAKTIMLKDDIL